ncbi:MAG: type I-C CRISPR-associated protein Cas8c/Csd1 [Lachnospiraceae bacterium]|jgi:CRISPR-associated protein Csd1|nr:type I-C CRISPR-associated protein Cas8c/Csd1 [Lachnospiraceae bacterium]
MIFYELVKLYEQLVQQEKISAPGWTDEKVSYGLMLNREGEVVQLVSLRNDDGKAGRLRVPQHPGRTSGVLPFFLWDNGTYLLGIQGAGKPEKARERFEASKKLHLDLLKEVDSEAAWAVKNFFLTWKPEKALEHEDIKPEAEELLKGANLTFYYGANPVTEDERIRHMWELHGNGQEDGEIGVCLVTGTREPIARLHPLIKGVRGAQPSGASLVSFNAEAFCSYELESGKNAQTGEGTARAYGAALNYLLADRDRTFTVGDVTVTGWVEEGTKGYSDLVMAMLNQEETFGDEEFQRALKKLTRGENITWKDQEIEPDHPFYVLGLSPNAARLSVRFFLKNRFGAWLDNIRIHEERLRVVLPAYVTKPYLPYWMILEELKAPGGKDTIPTLTVALLQSVLQNSRYPEELLYCTIRRIRAEHKLSWKRAAILKAYLSKNSINEKNREGLGVGLNTETNNQAYLLGRLFSLLESVQDASSGGQLNTTIKEQYLNSMCSTPALVMAQLLKLKESHIKKLRRDKPGLAINLDKQVMEIVDRLEIQIPRQLSLEEQAVFMLGYYHQTQKRYEKKQEEEV